MFDVLTIPNFIDPAPVLAELRGATAVAATVYGGRNQVESNVRRTKRLAASDELRSTILRHLRDIKPRVEEHFGVTTDEVEEPQFLHYEEGDFFVPHQDGNTPLIHDQTLARRISLVLFLSAPETHEGGALTLHGSYPNWDDRQIVDTAPGTLIAFRAETTHEVTPLTRGERFTIVSWYRVAS
jgi:SM-20-related protein